VYGHHGLYPKRPPSQPAPPAGGRLYAHPPRQTPSGGFIGSSP
jgi:hypothetical protein